jgi:exodeoxyribonuclease VII large subunit
VSAIGHESDRPLCDEVADLRCGTPSIAAHRVVPDRDALYAQVEGLLALVARDLGTRHHRAAERLGRAEVSGAMAAGTQRAADRLGHAQQRLAWSHPSAATGRARLRLEGCRWQEPVTAHLSSGYDRLEALGRHAASLSPRHVIERGFAVVRGPDGSVVRSPSQVTPGQRLSLSLAQGTLGAIVEDAGRGR